MNTPTTTPGDVREMERVAIGKALLAPDATDLVGQLQTDHFSTEAHERVWAAITPCAQGHIDQKAVLAALLDDPRATRAIGNPGLALSKCCDLATMAVGDFAWYASQIRDAAALRHGREAVERAARLLKTGNVDQVATALEEGATTLRKVTASTGDSEEGELLDQLTRDGAWLDAQHFPPLAYAVPGIIPEGLSLLAGAPKAGKSWLILATLLAIAAGGAALGKIRLGPPRRVLYLALEDGDRRMQDRCRSLLDGAPIPALFTYITRVPPASVTTVIETYLNRYPDTALVVVDTLGKVMPPAAPGETTYQRDYRVGGKLKAITDDRPGLALVAIHHDRKADADDFVERVSGTNGLAGAADTIIVLSRKRKSAEGVLAVTGRDVTEGEYALLLSDGGSWALDGDDLAQASARVDERAERGSVSDTTSDVLSEVRAAGPSGARAGDLAAKFGKDVYQYLRRQEEAGRLVRIKRGVYAAPESQGVSEVSEVRNGRAASDTSDTSDAGLWGGMEDLPEPPPDDHGEAA